MSLQPTNIPQLQNMGLTPAANMVNTGISAMISAREGGRDRRNKLLQALLGGGFDMGVQGLRNEGNLAMTEAQLKSPAQLALAVNRLATGAASPDQAGAIRDRVNRILGDIPGTGEEGQAPILPLEGSPIVDQVGDDAIQSFGGQGGVTGVPQGQEFAQSPSGAFQLGTQQQVASATPSYGMDLPLGMARQQAKIERDLAGKSLSKARENKTNIDAKRSGIGLREDQAKTFAPGYAEMPEKQPGAVDYDGVSLGIPNSPRVNKIQRSFTRLPKQELVEVRNKTASSFQDLQQFSELTKKFLSLKETNTVDRQRINAAINGLIPLENLREVEKVAVELNSLLDPAAIQAAAQFQGANSISNRDVEGIKNAIGNPKLPKEVFANLISRYLAKGYINGMGNAIAVDGILFQDMESNFENLTGNKLMPDDFVQFDKVRKMIKNGLVSGNGIQAEVTPGETRAAEVRPTNNQENVSNKNTDIARSLFF
jgi:hypothetical protein